MSPGPSPNQTPQSVGRNIAFFRDNLHKYGRNISELDTYALIRAAIDETLPGIDRLLDIGNGGVFDYDIRAVSRVVALDLFLDDIDQSAYPAHITFKVGSALNIPESDGSFDGVIMVMLLHHLVGETVDQSLENARAAIREARRVLRPGGRLIIVESCVPHWFYRFERAIFPLAAPLINRFLTHPATVQFPVNLIEEIAAEDGSQIELVNIPKGRWVLQYGFKFPPGSPRSLSIDW